MSLEERVIEMTEEMSSLEPGSEEYLNQAKAIEAVSEANVKDKEMQLQAKYKKLEVTFLGIGAVAGAFTAIGNLLTPVLRRFSNKDWIKAEDKGFYISNDKKDNR